MFKLFFPWILILVSLPSVSFSKEKKPWLNVEGEKNFSNIIVISKKFLTKTNRLEVFTYGATGINNAFYLDIAPGVDITYYFKEKYALSFSYLYFFNTKKKVTKDLEDATINAKLGFFPKQFVGAYFHWSPIYGKFALLNRKLIPFDLYFSLGLGQFSAKYTKKENSGEGAVAPFKSLALSAQMGQQFALSSSIAFHWKILWNLFPLPDDGVVRGQSNNILFGLGVSWFFGGKESR